MSVLYIFAITIFADICSNTHDISIFTDSGCIYAGIFVVIFKAMKHLTNYKKLTQLLEETFKCADDLSELFKAKRVKDITKKYYTRNAAVFYGFLSLGSILLIALLFFSPAKDGLPFRAKYPFNTTISPWHEISFTIEMWAVSSGLLAILAMDSILSLTCNFITMEFDMLNVNFENSGKETDDTDRICEGRIDAKKIITSNELAAKRRNDTFVYRYKMCLRFHQRLATMVKEYNKIYSSSMFVQMVSSTSIICLAGFQAVVVGGQSSDIVKFGVYLSAAISQIFYICWIGNELQHSSSVMDRSQWLSDWHRESFPEIVQIFTLSTMFSRQRLKIKAGPLYVLSLDTFIVIIKRSYSIFALLNSM